MKILCYSLNYTPELTGIGKYSGEMAQRLAQARHEVRVITCRRINPTGGRAPITALGVTSAKPLKA